MNKTLTVKFTQRNLKRIPKLLGLDCNLSGFFTSDKWIGYKTLHIGSKLMTYHFTSVSK